jgi:hypothetical protein
MPFDGVEWAAPMYSWPRAYQPHSPFTADVLQGSLINAYYAARRNGVLVLSQAYERNDADSLDGNGGWVLSTDTAGNLTSGYVYVPTQWTHARAFVAFECVTAIDTEVTHRISVVEGGTTVNGTSVVRAVTTNVERLGAPMATEENIGDSPGGLFFAQCEVSLGTLTLDSTVLFTVQGHAADVVFANFAAYRPRWVAVFLECRG